MANLTNRLMAWLRGTVIDAPAARLSESQAIEIARAAAFPEWGQRQLTMATRAVKDGRIIWSVSEPAIGSVLVVDIDDVTASAVAIRRVGLR